MRLDPNLNTAAELTPGCTRRAKVGVAWLWCGALLLLAWIPTSRAEEQSYLFQPASPEPLASDDCPSSCSRVFGRLEEGEGSHSGGRRVQTVHVQERGGASGYLPD